MKIKFYCNSGANIHSCREEILDPVKDLRLKEGEWEDLTEDEKYEFADDWAYERLEIGFEEIAD